MTSPQTAVTYLRSALPDHLDVQREQVTRTATELDAGIVAEFIDTDAATPGRDGLTALLDYVAEHEIDYCLVASRDKLTRSAAEGLTIDATFHAHGVTLVAAAEDTDVPKHQRFLELMMSTMAQWAEERGLADDIDHHVTPARR